MKFIQNNISKHPLLFLLIFYFIFALINVTLLPIFNDESIYLDWGWISLHVPGNAYISLTDAKQPFLIWIFGIFATIFPDPLFAGRFVSILIGSFTVAGIYSLTKKLFNTQTAFFAALVYTITPIFLFYNRQALLEAAIACVGVWSGSMLLTLLQKPTWKRGILLGIIMGLGFFIKSSSLIFIVSSAVIVLFYFFKYGKKRLFPSFLVSLVSILVVDFILLINPLFWQTFSSNDRYTYTLGELFSFPIIPWASHFYGFLQVGFIYITPFIFLAGLWGIYLLVKKKGTYTVGILLFFILALLLEIFTVKDQSQRYLVSFLPFFCIPAASVLWQFWNSSLLKKLTVAVSFFIPFVMSLVILFAPATYIISLAKISEYADMSDVTGYTAGYGINETLAYIQEHSIATQPTMVLFALWTGNPENALDVYSFKTPNMYPLRIDSQLFPNLASYQCMTSQFPAFFVTRDGNQAGLDKYFSLAQTIPTHDPTYSIKIYTLKKNCQGNTLSLSDAYQQLMSQEMGIK